MLNIYPSHLLICSTSSPYFVAKFSFFLRLVGARLLHKIMDPTRDCRGSVRSTLLRPSKWLPLYEDFVTKNASSVGQVESALRSLTYIIPGSFQGILRIHIRMTKTNTYE